MRSESDAIALTCYTAECIALDRKNAIDYKRAKDFTKMRMHIVQTLVKFVELVNELEKSLFEKL